MFIAEIIPKTDKKFRMLALVWQATIKTDTTLIWKLIYLKINEDNWNAAFAIIQ